MKFQKREHLKTLKISNDYHEHLKDVALYGIEMFGERVSREFIAKIEVKVACLPLLRNISFCMLLQNQQLCD